MQQLFACCRPSVNTVKMVKTNFLGAIIGILTCLFCITEGYCQWNTLHSYPRVGDTLPNIQTINFYDAQNGIAACGEGNDMFHFAYPNQSFLLSTHDGGLSWDTLMKDTLRNFDGIARFGRDTIIVSASFVYNKKRVSRKDSSFMIARTIDGGITWDTSLFSRLDINTYSNPDLLIKTNDSTLIIPMWHKLKSQNYFLKTTNRGMSWDTVAVNFTPSSYLQLDDTTGILTSYNISFTAQLYFVDENLALEDSVQIDTINYSDMRVKYVHDSLLFVIAVLNYDSTFFYKSTDKGRSWELISNLDSIWWPPRDFEFISDSIAFMSEGNGWLFPNYNRFRLFKTTDGCKTWEEVSYRPPFTDSARWYLDIFPLNEDTVFIAGGQQFYSTYNGGRSTVHLSEFEESLYKHLKIYPNPTQGQVIVPQSEELESIAVLDLNGRLVQDVTPSLGEETTIEIKGEAGMYILQFQMQDGSVQSTKVVKR